MKRILVTAIFLVSSCSDQITSDPDFSTANSKSLLIVNATYLNQLDEISDHNEAVLVVGQNQRFAELNFNADRSSVNTRFASVPSNKTVEVQIKFYNSKNELVAFAKHAPLKLHEGEEKTISIDYIKLLNLN